MNKIFTVGYGNKKPDDLISILKINQVVAIVDVRLRPDRARLGTYVKAKSTDKGIQKFLSTNGIKYYSFVELGNVFMNYEDWEERYKELLEKTGEFLTKGLNEVPQPLCLLCAEKDASECHRKIISDYLQSQGWKIKHLE